MKRKKNNAVDASKRQRGIDRKLHFESGGTVIAWRGRHVIEENKKLQEKRKSCRKFVDEEHL